MSQICGTLLGKILDLKNFHLPLAEPTNAQLRAEAERVPVPVAPPAREVIDSGLKEQAWKATHDAIAACAAEMAGADPRSTANLRPPARASAKEQSDKGSLPNPKRNHHRKPVAAAGKTAAKAKPAATPGGDGAAKVNTPTVPRRRPETGKAARPRYCFQSSKTLWVILERLPPPR